MNTSIPEVALITGAAKRIGAEIATHLHTLGYQLIVHYRTSCKEAEALAAKLNAKRPHSVVIVQADLNLLDDIHALVAAVPTYWGRLDLLVNNASTFYATPFEQVTEKAWNDLHASNVKAPFFLVQGLAKLLTASQGSVVNILDIHAKRPQHMHNYMPYCAAKAGLHLLTEMLALELAPQVRVNGIAPGFMLPSEDGSLEAFQSIIAAIPLERVAGAAVIAEAVAYLAHADYVTGTILKVDGGLSLVV